MNRPRIPLTTVLVLLAGTTLVNPATAQDGDTGTKANAPTSRPVATAMVLETTDIMVGTGFLGRFDPQAELPDITGEQYYRLTLMSDGKIRHATAAGDIGWLRATIHPAALMTLFATTIEENWEQVSGGAIIGLTQLGMTTQDAAKLMKSVRSFPQQIKSIHVGLSSNPRTQFKGLGITASIEPTKGMWLDDLAKHLRPHAQGAPTLDVKDPMMWVGVAIEPEALNTFSAPMIKMFAKLGGDSKKERQKTESLYLKVMNMQDGTFVSAGDPFGGGMRTIAGLRDSKTFDELLHSAEYGRMAGIAEDISPNIETDFEAVAFTHRDIKVAKMTVTTDIDTPVAPAGDQINYSAVAGDYFVSTSAMKPEATKQLIDMGLDQKVKRAPLPGNALIVADFKLMDLLTKIIPFGNPLEGEDDPPQKLHMTFDNKNGTLNATIQFK